jgi:hypothetical protein
LASEAFASTHTHGRASPRTLQLTNLFDKV